MRGNGTPVKWTWLSFWQQQHHWNFQGVMNYYPPSVLQNVNSSWTKITVQQMSSQQSNKSSFTWGYRKNLSRKLLAQMTCQKQSGILLKARENGQLDNETQNKQSAMGRGENSTSSLEVKLEDVSYSVISFRKQSLTISTKFFLWHLSRVAVWMVPQSGAMPLSWVFLCLDYSKVIVQQACI